MGHCYLEYVATQNFSGDPVLLMEERRQKKLNKSKKENKQKNQNENPQAKTTVGEDRNHYHLTLSTTSSCL